MAASGRRGKEGGRAGTGSTEKGVCIICGGEKKGVPAAPEIPIRASRWLRALFRQPPKHTIACGEHLAEARQRRQKYEKRQRNYIIAAALFFVLVVAGSFAFGRSDLCLFAPAIIGALFIAALPSFYYFPSFGK